jgi:hypothetical protein
MNTFFHVIPHGVLGAFVGGLLGYGYYRFVGCATGTCPLTSNPYITTLYGAVIGFVFTAH